VVGPEVVGPEVGPEVDRPEVDRPDAEMDAAVVNTRGTDSNTGIDRQMDSFDR